MAHSGFYKTPQESKTAQYKDNLLVREGYMTTRQGYPAVELRYPIVVREDLPEYRSRDGTQLGPVFVNPDLPWHKHENAKGNYYPKHHPLLSKAEGNGHKKLTVNDTQRIMSQCDSFKNGHYFPYARNYNMHYQNLPQGDYNVPLQNPSNFNHKSDELRKWLFGLR